MTRGVHVHGTLRFVVGHDSYYRITPAGSKVVVNVLTLACGHVVKRENQRPTRARCVQCGCPLCPEVARALLR